MKDVILHGEAMVIKIDELPKGLKKKEINDKYQIIAPSEVTGNHHIIDKVDTLEFYEDNIGRLFFRTDTPTKVRCIVESRHDAIAIEPGIYEVGIQQEYDPFTARKRNVAD